MIVSLKNLRNATQKIGPLDEPVLILGPTGSDKELVAWDLHEASRRSGPYYRINVLQIHITPLNERLEDMKSIASNLLFEMKNKGFSYSLHKGDWQSAFEYDWPGNIRQFINLLKRAVYLIIRQKVA